MTIGLILILLLGGSVALLLLQCVAQLKMKVDAGLIFGFSIFFDFTGFYYKRYVHGSSLFLLIAIPFLLGAAAVLFRKAEKPMSPVAFKGFALWGIFFFYTVLSLAWALDSDYGMYKEKMLFIHGIFPGICAYLAYRRYRVFSWTWVAVFGLGYSVTHQLFGQYTQEYPDRLTLPGGNPIFDARMLFIAVTVALWGKRIPLLLRLAVIGFGMTSALATQSRGPLVSFIGANLLVLLLTVIRKRRNGQWRLPPAWANAVGYAFVGAAAAAWLLKDQLLESLGGSRFTVLVSGSQLAGDANFVDRRYLQEIALGRFIAHPFFGTGMGGPDLNGYLNYPHNLILEMAGELGMVGLLLWAIAFAFTCRVAWHHAAVLALLVQTFASTLFSGDFGFNYEYMMVAVAALALWREPKDKEEKEEAGDEHERREQREKNFVPHYQPRLRRS